MFAQLMKAFAEDPRYRGFRERRKPEIKDHLDWAGNLYRWFPTHFYKAQHVIYEYERTYCEWITSLLQQDYISVVDIGAGVGTFCLALIDALYKEGKNPVLDLVLVEPNMYHHDLAREWLNRYTARVGVRVRTLEIVPKLFPEDACLQEVISLLKQLPVQFLVIALCNIVNWLDPAWLRGYRKECEFVSALVDQVGPMHAVLFSVETKSWLGGSVRLLYNRLARFPNVYRCEGPAKVTITFKNFPGSAYDWKTWHDLTYWYGIFTFNTAIAKMTDREKLKWAYFKARMGLRREFPSDEVEIKLFEKDLEKNLASCGNSIQKEYNFCAQPLQFFVPKDSKKKRPRVLDSVADAVVGSAFIEVLGRPIDNRFLPVSCGNRLGKEKSEFTYRWFWKAWRSDFMGEGISMARDKGYTHYRKLDIRSFYPSIPQSQLLKRLENIIPAQDQRIRRLVESFIYRKWLGADSNRGLPQGPLTSGLLANVYLHEFDREMAGNGTYWRYVDDILLFGRNGDLDAMEEKAGRYLKERLGLSLNDDKISKGTIEDLEAQLNRPELDKFDRLFRRLLRSLYSLDRKHYRLYRSDRWQFARLYARCLQELGIYTSEWWLVRRLTYEHPLRRFWLILVKKRISLHFPRPPVSPEDAERWGAEFRKLNPRVLREIDHLKKLVARELVVLYNKYGIPDEKTFSKAELNRVRSSYRFYTYRAGIIHAPGAVPVLRSMLLHPVYYVHLALRPYRELTDDLIRFLHCGGNEYVRCIMAWALGELRAVEAVPVLQDALFSDESPVMLKLVAAQALLRIDHWDSFDCVRLRNEIKKRWNEPRLLKSLLMLLRPCGLDKENMREYEVLASSFGGLETDLCLAALDWVLNRDGNLLDLPDVLPDNIDPKDYPDIEPIGQDYYYS